MRSSFYQKDLSFQQRLKVKIFNKNKIKVQLEVSGRKLISISHFKNDKRELSINPFCKNRIYLGLCMLLLVIFIILEGQFVTVKR